jgi:ribosome-associated protein
MKAKVVIKATKSLKDTKKAEKISISTEYIKLDAFLKFACIASTGGEAKLMIEDGLIKVNGEGCTQRGKKLRPGDRISVNGELFEIISSDEGEDGN